jgi:aspartate racemase
VGFAEIERLQREGQWDVAADLLVEAARRIERAGASFLVICSNTMHRVAAEIEAAIDLPLLHIADAVADQLEKEGARIAGLLGTRFTMEEHFYVDRLSARHGIEVIVPPEEDRQIVDRVIYEELCVGDIRNGSRAEYHRIMDELVSRGAQGVIAGCTEVGMLARPDRLSVPFFDSTAIHAEAAVALALA